MAIWCIARLIEASTSTAGYKPFSAKRRNYLANLHGVVSEPLTAADMQAIAGIDRNCRLIKGQVFLWKQDQTWEDLWDLDGVIAQ